MAGLAFTQEDPIGGCRAAGAGVTSACKKHTVDETLKLVVPAHRPIKRSTVAHILKQAQLPLDDFLALL